MSDQTTPSTQSSNISNEDWAFLGLRLWLALRWFFAGLDKFGSPGNYSFENYYAKMAGMAGGTGMLVSTDPMESRFPG